MPELCLVNKALLAISQSGTGEKRIVLIPEGANVRILASCGDIRWARVQWDGIEVAVFKQDLEQRTAALPNASRSRTA